ncbi:MFS transporter [Robertkochia marina]|uniref:MFS transporter n=1 Tax=Robertkochia marina TaxID=1227945 RepID=A0A4S3M5P3_9FLAO|nr:MFS transporter [Robertkochia marina]THD69681.1 MFS transporter [Robertkochia marina]TRZ47057.1 MFS transporter [Robertkochia marina]
MNDLLRFFKANIRPVGFAWSMTFLSGFGQTFLLSLYVPELLRILDLEKAEFGSIYAVCTVVASVIMLSIGHTIDHKPVKRITTLVLLSLAASCFFLGFSAWHISLLFIAFTGLRLNGQGMLTHIGFTLMSRCFDNDRGKALSLTSLGFSVGEAVFPLLVSAIILQYGFKAAALASGLVLIVYALGVQFMDLKDFDRQQVNTAAFSWKALGGTFSELIKDKRFFIIVSPSFALGFISTAIFFYQYVFAEEKGWSLPLYASFFTAYAVTRFLLSIAGGIWVDRYGARKLFGMYLFPMSIGLLFLSFVEHIYGALVFLILSGISMGIAGTVKTAVIAEVYGTARMGTIRSLFTMFMVFSTAMGPLLIGALLDQGVSFSRTIFLLFVFMVLAQLNALRILKVPRVREVNTVEEV